MIGLAFVGKLDDDAAPVIGVDLAGDQPWSSSRLSIFESPPELTHHHVKMAEGDMAKGSPLPRRVVRTTYIGYSMLSD